MIRPLDFVETPAGNLALVVEVQHIPINSMGDTSPRACLEFIGEQKEASSWWEGEDLKIVDNLADLMSRKMRHPAAEDTYQPYKREGIAFRKRKIGCYDCPRIPD